MGTSIVGTIFSHHYASVVERTMSVLGPSASAQWTPRLSDPRILVDEALRDRVLSKLGAAGLDAPALVDAARDALVQSIHIGVMLTSVAALVAALLVRCGASRTSRSAGRQRPSPGPEPASFDKWHAPPVSCVAGRTGFMPAASAHRICFIALDATRTERLRGARVFALAGAHGGQSARRSPPTQTR